MTEEQTTEEQTTEEQHSQPGQPDGQLAESNTTPDAAKLESDSADTAAGSDHTAGSEQAAPPKKKRTKSTARKTRTVELTLTVTGTAEGEWQAELMHGSKRVVQGLSVPAAAVSKAAKELHQDISDTIEDVLQQARQQHEAKLAELEAEVERVRKQLADLEGSGSEHDSSETSSATPDSAE